jgi:hypothetical protein
MTIYNTPDHFMRRYFLELINAIHSFDTPAYLMDPGQMTQTELRTIRVNAAGSGGTSGSGSFGGFLGKISNTVKQIDKAITDVKGLFNRASTVVDTIQQGGYGSFESLTYGPGYPHRPWYQQDITIQQLDHSGRAISQVTILNAFITNVGPVEYDDSEGDVTKTTITFAFSGLEYADTNVDTNQPI